jgi:Fic family protein
MAAVKYHLGAFPPKKLELERLLPLVGPASAAVARYEGVLHGMVNAQVLLSPLFSQEAVLSSRIEGTQATLGEVLEFEAGKEVKSKEKRDDIMEVLNYRAAMNHAVEAMKTLPLSQRVIRDAHRVLMDGVRGENKSPGEYRKIPNWIGPPNCKEEQARFVPPSAAKVPELMSEWEKYLHKKDVPDRLIQLAILHAEFEAIHPFLDGNGRIGRLLVPLFLVDKGLLSGPNFYVSAYLEARRDEYYEGLLAVSRDGDWTGWCVYFLNALKEQAEENEAKAREIWALYQRRKDWIVEKTRSQYAVRALDWFFKRPLFTTPDFVASTEIPDRTAKRIVEVVRDEGMLRVVRPASGKRAAILAFPELLNAAEGAKVL